ncbi:hypothetical protein PV08_07496 [Exophiala spinifera]|uniref:MARVEL domain-containing protein n=1 Tax=Exophiala spinifera TaxID=91928 RepID=A0A0D1ZPG8_9EURO|nr:uncharacterized protein PV08_07496 [Exophiala spinifera]KIW14712.1 hypothetical protein PV08_07496 [Exophiala spinifera]
MPTTKMRSRPQVYPRLAFHVIRGIAFISASVVSGILIYFCLQLKHDGFKLPWTFIVILLSSLLSLLALLVTSLVYAFAFLNPLLNLISNSSILLVWTVGIALLTYNMYGTLGHSCSRANWANDDGMMICRTYKAFYSFNIFGWLAQVALIVLDVRSRRKQTALGRYNKMMAEGAAAADDKDVVRLNHLDPYSYGSGTGTGTGTGADARAGSTAGTETQPQYDQSQTQPLYHSHSHSQSEDDVPYGVTDYSASRQMYRPAQARAPAPTYSSSAYGGYDNSGYGHGQGQIRMDQFSGGGGGGGGGGGRQYDHFNAQSYSNGGYGYGPQR